MSWCDKKSIEVINKLRDIFNVNTFIETGTFMGINAKVQSSNFNEIITCELKKEYYKKAKRKLKDLKNVSIVNASSPSFLKEFVKKYKKDKRNDIIIIYLDAHFYSPQLPQNDRFVVLSELKMLKDFENCVIIIHDFDNNLGHITYDGIPLNLELIRSDLYNINPNFAFYTNELSSCDIHTEKSIQKELPGDLEALDNIKYARSNPRLSYRGILYCIPKEVNVDGIKKW